MKAINRLYQYIDYHGIKPANFEKKISLSNGYLGTQKKRNADLGSTIVENIINNCPDLNLIWLITGRGEMLINDNNKAHGIEADCNSCPLRDDIERYQQDIDRYRNEIDYLNSELRTLRQQNTPEPKRRSA
jgi:hypothetical protein